MFMHYAIRVSGLVFNFRNLNSLATGIISINNKTEALIFLNLFSFQVSVNIWIPLIVQRFSIAFGIFKFRHWSKLCGRVVPLSVVGLLRMVW